MTSISAGASRMEIVPTDRSAGTAENLAAEWQKTQKKTENPKLYFFRGGYDPFRRVTPLEQQ
jgi:hypothetical protein